MEDLNLEKNLKALQALYPHAEGELRTLRLGKITGLPIWIKGAVDIYELPFLGAPSAPLYLLVPKENMALEHLMRIYKQLHEKLHAHILVIADALPAKHRPLLVKFRIPFIYKDESIFAPELGLKFGNLKKFEPTNELEFKNTTDALTPFALKIIAGLLTDQIPEAFTLKNLYENLQENTKLSLSKLSMTLNELSTNGILLTQSAGPKKSYTKNENQKTWDKVLSGKLAPFFREVQTNYIPEDRSKYTIAGETALAHYSNLATPKRATIAITAGEFRSIYQGAAKNTIPYGDWDKPSLVQIWKEDPGLFSFDGAINPIEVFFSMRDNSDERVQMSLDEMLKTYGLLRKES